MRPQIKLTFALIAAYSLFMLWWFMCEDAPKPGSRPTVVSTKVTQTKKTVPVPSANGKSGTSATTNPGFAPEGRVVAKPSAQHIRAEEIGGFKPYLYPGGKPYYAGDPVTAYVRVPSTKQELALTVNQAGEFPQLNTAPGEVVQVRLAFTKTAPSTPIALTSEDGGLIEGGVRSSAGKLDAARQIAFAYTVSNNRGIHRVTVTTPLGETQTLEFWAGLPMQMKPGK